jgi:hypothetical protein
VGTLLRRRSRAGDKAFAHPTARRL